MTKVDDLEYTAVRGRTLITASAWRSSNNAAMGGIGLLISAKAEAVLSEVIKWNERILIAHFTGNPAIRVVAHYAPVEGSDSAEEHYMNLADAINSIPKHNILLVMGDFNAHIGKDFAKHAFHDNTNTNGDYLIDLTHEADMFIANTHFQKRTGKKWTYISDMCGVKAQNDYILLNNKWKNTLKNCEPYSSFSSIGSDHRVLTASLKLSLRKRHTPAGRINYEWSLLRNSTLADHYTISVKIDMKHCV